MKTLAESILAGRGNSIEDNKLRVELPKQIKSIIDDVLDNASKVDTFTHAGKYTERMYHYKSKTNFNIAKSRLYLKLGSLKGIECSSPDVTGGFHITSNVLDPLPDILTKHLELGSKVFLAVDISETPGYTPYICIFSSAGLLD